MGTQTISINFQYLRDFTAENINDAIPLKRAVEVTLVYDAYETGEVSEYEIFKSWAISLFKQYGPGKICGSDLKQLLNLFSKTIEGVIIEYKECLSESPNNRLLDFLHYSLELFTWIQTVAAEFDSNEITLFLCFGLSLINNCLMVFSTSSLTDSKLLKKSLAIQAVILGILSVNPKTFCFDKDSGSLCSNLILHLCAVGELTPKFDVKTAVDTWKGITKLVSNNVTRTQSEDNSFIDVVWLKRPLSFIVKEIGENVQTVYKEISLSEPIQQIEKYLKVTNFYLRLLQKLTTDFQHVPFPVCEDFISTLGLILTPPGYIINTPVHKVITEYITNGFKELIPFAYRNDLFVEHLLSEHIGDDAFYEILFEIIQLAIHRNESQYLSPLLFDTAFARLSRSVHVLMFTSKYNRFVDALSAMQIRFQLKPVENTLVNAVLQNDIVLAMAAIDIWCTIFRVSTNSTRLTYFAFWRDINERFAKFSNRLPAFFVEVLLNNLYISLTTREHDEVWNKFNVSTLNNERFLSAIGLDSIPNISVKKSIIEHFVNELTRFLGPSSNDMKVDAFYTIVKDLRLLTPIEFQNDELIDILFQFLSIAMTSRKFKMLVESILNFTALKLESIDDSRKLAILTGLGMDVSFFEDHSAKLCLVNFLSKVSESHRLEKHCQEIFKMIESDKLISNLWNTKAADAGVDPANNEDIFQNVLKNRSIEKMELTHICTIKQVGHAKKQIEANTKFLLESLEDNVNQLEALTQIEQLSVSNIEIINRLTRKLQKIVSSS